MKRIILFLLVIVGLSHAKPNLTPEVQQMINELKKSTKGVSLENLQKELKDDSVILIDVRTVNEWKKGAIPSKRIVKIQRGLLEFRYPLLILDRFKKTDSFVVYCNTDPRSIFATKRLQDLGFTNVRYLEGGYKRYKELNNK